MTTNTNAIAFLSLAQLEDALLSGAAQPADVVTVLNARLAKCADKTSHKAKRTSAFLARVQEGKLAKGTTNELYAALKAEGEAKAQARNATPKAKAAFIAKPIATKPAKPAKAKAQPKAVSADPMSVIATSLAQLASGQQAMMKFLAKLDK